MTDSTPAYVKPHSPLAAHLFDVLTDANLAAAEHMRLGREQGRRECIAQVKAFFAQHGEVDAVTYQMLVDTLEGK